MTPLAPLTRTAAIAQAADKVAARHAFADYRDSKADNTISRQDDDIACFELYLHGVGLPLENLALNAEAWRGISYGLVAAFVKWMLREGCAIGTVNVRLSTVKTYAKLAAQANVLTTDAYALIKTVGGYRHAEGKRIDEKRPLTRQSTKKAAPVELSDEQVRLLRTHPTSPQGRRDAVLMGLLMDLGLRVSEVCALTVESVNLKAATITFYRSKVNKTQTHRLPRKLLSALRAYITMGDVPMMATSPLLRQSLKNGRLSEAGITRNGIGKRVRELGAKAGLPNLSPHDFRHHWATVISNNGTPLDAAQDAGGWNSPAMPIRYKNKAKIANAGVKLDEED